VLVKLRITGDSDDHEEASVEATTIGGLLVEVIGTATVEFPSLRGSNIPEDVSICQTDKVI
jgi:hypothetical protein